MKRTILISALLTIAFGTLYMACQYNMAEENEPKSAFATAAQIKRGAYLVATIACDDCHSPKRMGEHGPELIPELRLSGFRQDGKVPSIDTTEVKKGWILFNEDLTSAVGPWGESFSANLTSDETGIGNWTEAQFIKALREGKLKGLEGTRSILPPMPWPIFKNLNDRDIKAIFAFLKSTKPVKNMVPQPKVFKDLK